MTGRNSLGRGRTGKLLTIGFVALAFIVVVAFPGSSKDFGPSWPGLITFAIALAGLAAAVLAVRYTFTLREGASKVSHELDSLSARLLRLEARLADPERQDAARLTSTVAEVTGEIAVLGGLIRDLAVTVASQDRDVAAIKTEIERARVLAAEPVRSLTARMASPAAVPPPMPRPAAAPRPMPPAATAAAKPAAPREKPVVPSLLPAAEAAPAPAPRSRETAAAAPDGVDARRIAAVMDAFETDRIELHLQPVVSLPQRKARFYEVLARLRLADETVLVPAEFLPVLERCGLMGDLDRKVLTRAAGIARHLASRGSDARVSCNLSPASIETGILRVAGRVAEAYPDVADRLMLELPQSVWRTLDADKLGTVALLRRRGMLFALDRVADLRFDAMALAERGVAYLKIPAEMLLRGGSSRGLDLEVADLAAVLKRAGVRLVAERVEREEDVPNLIELEVPLGQGFVFAPPRAVRADVLGQAGQGAVASAAEPAARPATAVDGAATAAPHSDERPVPFRTVLRRAG